MRITNRTARYNYKVLETFEAGVKLTGPEVKSVKNGRMKLEGSYVKIIDNEAYLVNASIPPYEYARQKNYDPNHTRKLLLHRKEIISLQSKMKGANLTLIPLSCYTKKGLVKVQIALAKGKKKYEKKKAKKRRDIEKEIQREIKQY